MRLLSTSIAAAVLSHVLLAQAPDPGSRIVQSLETRRDAFTDVAMKIWELAEVGYQEVRSSALLQQQLGDAGFKVEAGVAEIPTAFTATYGSGKPVIGIVGEFDALPGLSQAATPERRPVQEGGAGHGCGHHLFGTASAAAAIATKEWLAASGRAGTIRFYGTPAEEGGSGKVYMVRAGLFDDVDAVVSWHPGDRNESTPSSTLANITAKFRFRGVSAHAAGAPEKGRSALDGVEAMTHMVNMLREHVPQETRIHYVITRGGAAPNVVPDFAEAYVYARHNDMSVLDGVWERIVDASKGAALGTGTTVDHEITGAVYNVLPNSYLSSVLKRNLERVGGVTYTPEERAFAEKIRATLSPPLPPLGSEKEIVSTRGEVASSSTDMGDVSWRVPTVQLTAATWVPGTPAHSWQAVAAGGTGIGAKGMMVAAKTMALTAVDLIVDPQHLVNARAEFDKRRAGHAYTSRLGNRKPALDYRR
ncbi:MAG TPA: amidohydrolase [Vicinamibacterales bacterium]|nr:amidohydrolase [Vicinamibacterales bacterium]